MHPSSAMRFLILLALDLVKFTNNLIICLVLRRLGLISVDGFQQLAPVWLPRNLSEILRACRADCLGNFCRDDLQANDRHLGNVLRCYLLGTKGI